MRTGWRHPNPSLADGDRIPAVRRLDTAGGDNFGSRGHEGLTEPEGSTMTAHSTPFKATGRVLVASGFTTVLTTATVAALLAATVATASAAPTRAGEEAGPRPGASRLVDIVCFNTPHQWNVALDGPLPGCSRTVR